MQTILPSVLVLAMIVVFGLDAKAKRREFLKKRRNA